MLKHYPNKKASNTTPVSNSLYLTGINQNINDDAFFTCIQKAHEILTNTEKRRQFDSVDPVFMELEDDSLPRLNSPRYGLDEFGGNFFLSVGCATDIVLTIDKTLAPVFELYSQFSKAQPVPGFGHVDSSRRWWKDLMISGTTWTVGKVSGGWIKG